jgi:hypothetical protein
MTRSNNDNESESAMAKKITPKDPAQTSGKDEATEPEAETRKTSIRSRRKTANFRV